MDGQAVSTYTINISDTRSGRRETVRAMDVSGFMPRVGDTIELALLVGPVWDHDTEQSCDFAKVAEVVWSSDGELLYPTVMCEMIWN